MTIRFHKMHGLGNDFVLVDLRRQDAVIDAGVARRMASRHQGIGCDQVIVVRRPDSRLYLASFEFWNADGSRAEQCGNGVRCIGAYLKRCGDTPGGNFLLKGPAGVVSVTCLDDGQVSVDMGEPEFTAEKVPLTLQKTGDWYTIEIDGESIRLDAASMGNPHALLLVENTDTADVDRLGALIGANDGFPKGCNVGFAEIVDREHIRLRVYERGGVGETLACGSGSCAAVSILRKHGMVSDNVRVTQPGGSLIISWSGSGNPVVMTGPATYVFKGNFYDG
jgi:diaminopimelate epimerase